MLGLREPAHTTLKYSLEGEGEGGDGERGGKRRVGSWQVQVDVTLLKCLFMKLPLHSTNFSFIASLFFPPSCYFWSSFPRVSDQSLFYLDSAPCPHAAMPAALDYPISIICKPLSWRGISKRVRIGITGSKPLLSNNVKSTLSTPWQVPFLGDLALLQPTG